MDDNNTSGPVNLFLLQTRSFMFSKEAISKKNWLKNRILGEFKPQEPQIAVIKFGRSQKKEWCVHKETHFNLWICLFQVLQKALEVIVVTPNNITLSLWYVTIK